MAFSTFLKTFALLALLAVNVSAAASDSARRLRIEPSAVLPPTRELSGKNPINWIKIVKDNIKNQPVLDKTKEMLDKINYYKKLKEKAQGKHYDKE
ncbi:hypothetical protein PHYBOEH_001463 [Phytophthora boehmeriae]|uniref:RxLR effector protein n=1 Tax=Phytophthora boehmeriae TaxID=109152 RepID=A0A8T1V8F2_9STRA|nr:hypothetical protein PHYBOEH_001463 [Phytophthora boehmeriae]